MRIIAGRFKGRTLASVGKGDTAAQLRPTTDRVRESLFNVLAGGKFGDPVTGMRVLDLFAGTGALGLEALSRGAATVNFVENGRVAQAILAKNISLFDVGQSAIITKRDATRPGLNMHAPYDLVFLDPPYGRSLGETAIGAALAGNWIAPGALIIWEENTAINPPPGLTQLDQRQYGKTNITLLTHP